jgi:sarcosine oxidase subunit beta
MGSATESYDAIVVGGGSIGVPAAFYLAERGLRVLVIDRRAAVGQGENKAAIGGVRATHSDPAKILLCLRTLAVVRGWKEEHGDEIGFKPGGYCFPVYDEALEATLRGLLPIQHRFGLVNDFVDADTIAALVPGIERAGLRGGTYSPGDCQVSPLLLPVVLMRHALRRGATLRVGERVVEYLRRGDAVCGVRTDRGSYHADRVVVATGAEAAGDGRLLGIELPVVPDSHEAGISAPVAPFLAPLVVDMRPGPEGKTANFYFGQNHEGQVIFCYTPKQLFLGDCRESRSEFLPILAGRMVALVPRLRHLLIRRLWRGLYPMTPDGVPIIGNVAEVPGLTVAVGMCGQGFMLGIGVGQEVASLVVDGRWQLPDEAVRAIRYGREFQKGKVEALK